MNSFHHFSLFRFDIMVNGGGTISLQFSRARLKSRVITVNTLWNQFVNIDPVFMYLHDDKEEEVVNKPCINVFHNDAVIYPIVRTTWKEINGYFYDNAIIMPETGNVRNEIKIIDTNLKLIYTTSQAGGFYSTIYILLTPSEISEELVQVHLKIVIEGVMTRQVFDAYPNLKHEHSWDRRNAYDQRVFGVTYAKGN